MQRYSNEEANWHMQNGCSQLYVIFTAVSKSRMMSMSLWNHQGPFYEHGLAFIQAWISKYIHYQVWDEITYLFLNFNGATVEVRKG